MGITKHSLHRLFPLLVLSLFALLAVPVLLMTGSIYATGAEKAQAAYESDAALSYITEKLRHSDEIGSVSLGQIEGSQAIIITQVSPVGIYDTYIYCQGGFLRELMVRRDVPAGADTGRKLLPLEEFTVEELRPGLLELRCTGTDGVQTRHFAALMSREVTP